MGYMIVERVFSPERAARELTERGDEKRAREVLERGEGTFAVTQVGNDRDLAEKALALHAFENNIDGVRYHLRTSYDVAWDIQNLAIEEALREVPKLRARSAVVAVNAFNRCYWGRDSRWDIFDYGDSRWRQTEARNFADAAYLVANALAGLSLADPERVQPVALSTAARIGWDLDEAREDADLTVEVWLAYSLGRTLRQCGEGRLERLCEAIEAGSRGNS